MTLLKIFARIIQNVIEDLLRPISGPAGIRLRRMYYRRRFAACGTNLRIGPGVLIQAPEFMKVGDNVWLDRNSTFICGIAGDAGRTRLIENHGDTEKGCVNIGTNCHVGINAVIQGHGGVSIGDYFTCSANCCIYSLSNDPSLCRHGTVGTEQTEVFYVESPVVLGCNVWLGIGVVAIGAKIGNDCFVKPGAVVTGEIESNSIVGGFPAKRQRERFPQPPVETEA